MIIMSLHLIVVSIFTLMFCYLQSTVLCIKRSSLIFLLLLLLQFIYYLFIYLFNVAFMPGIIDKLMY